MTDEVSPCTCITCGDQGIEMVVLTCDAASALARCRAGDGSLSEVDTGLVNPVAPGTRLMVHAGTAIAALAAVGITS
jgi:hypothetical protein